jgi:hypothetical protein
MSPENQGVLQLLKEVTFRRILAFFTANEDGAILAIISYDMVCTQILHISAWFFP